MSDEANEGLFVEVDIEVGIFVFIIELDFPNFSWITFLIFYCFGVGFIIFNSSCCLCS